MFNPLQSRTLRIECDALPTWGGAEILIPQRVRGVEALGELFQYEVDFASVDSPTFRIWDARKLLKPDDLIGKTIGIQIEFEGKGTFIPGLPGDLGAGNVGAGVRTINGIITEVQQTGSDDRRVYYRFTVRPWLWLATQNRDSRVFQDMSVLDVTESVLKSGNYKFPWKTRLAAVALNNNVFPKRDFIRQFWQSDYEFLQQLWTEWGIYYHFDGMTLVLCDSPGSHKKHGNAYDTVLYHAPEDKRIDEEHIHSLKVLRQITPGDVTVNDYDYTLSNGSFDRNQQRYSESSFDNIAQYHWGDYTQPLAGAMGLDGQPNDHRNEADYLARVRVEALRSEGFRLHATANARGIMTGRRLKIEGHPEQKLNADYLVVSTSIDIRNPDELTATPGSDAQYHCVTEMVLQPATIFFKLVPTQKPRAHPETAVVVGPEKQPLWLDGYARVRVQFKWDRLGQMAELRHHFMSQGERERRLNASTAILNAQELKASAAQDDVIGISDQLNLESHWQTDGVGRTIYVQSAPKLREPTKSEILDAAKNSWTRYLGDYDEKARAAWHKQFLIDFDDYSKRTLNPLAAAHSAWMQSEHLANHFNATHDETSAEHGLVYARQLVACVQDTQIYQPCLNLHYKWAKGSYSEPNNLLLRGLVLNLKAQRELITKQLSPDVTWTTVGWDNLCGFFNGLADNALKHNSEVLPQLVLAFGGAITKLLRTAVGDARVPHGLVALGTVTQRPVVPVQLTGTFKAMRASVMRQLLKAPGVKKVSENALQQQVTLALRRLAIQGQPMNKSVSVSMLVMIDQDTLHSMPKGLSKAKQAEWVASSLHTVEEVEALNIAARQQLMADIPAVVGAAKAGTAIAKAVPIVGNIVAAYVQIESIRATGEALGTAAGLAKLEVNARLIGGASLLISVPAWHLVPTSTDLIGTGICYAVCCPLWAYLIWMLLKESYRWTHFPIRFNHRKRMVFVFCLDGVIRSAKWDDLFFTISRCKRSFTPGSGPQIWDIRGHALKADRQTVEWTFALPCDSEDPRQLKNCWEFVRRYMEEGPKAVYGDVFWCHDIATRRETYREGLFALNLYLNGLPRLVKYISAPVVWLISIGRLFAMRTSKIPQWPAEIESQCRIDPSDPYQRTAAQNPAKFPTDPISVVLDQISK
ncbi:type VI secretion system tip protein TssI/VgrG [Caballeronia sp. GAFFF1]|uniref:type VI secretion system tip protein TssI/VgrG n=1 Tax=Caballeronia sp. GAFFF1 TaxID=2921779 RepID=UPI002028714D|nr:type VI secretion system tip protein TssI/VgrG [Caballeronia sp. GAFFF1]